jgi:non-ribosomal peptide synthetase component E (peptide arylation enzyme)
VSPATGAHGLRPPRLLDDTIDLYFRTGFWGNFTWGDYVDRNADLYPTKPAIFDRDGHVTCADLGEATDALALALLELGIEAGDVVAIQLPNWWEFIACRFALSKMGAIACPINSALRLHDVKHLFGIARPAAFVTTGEWRGFDYVAMVEDLRTDWPELIHIVVGDDSPGGKSIPFSRLAQGAGSRADLRSEVLKHRPDANDLDFLNATSGTTQGVSKLAMRTHNAYLSMEHQYIWCARIVAEDVTLSPAPITQAVGSNCYLMQAITGASVVEIERFDPEVTLAALEEHGCTFMFCVPTQIVDMLNSPRAESTDFSSLKRVIVAGSYVPPEVAQSIEQVTGARCLIAYGSIDASASTCVTMDDPPEKRYHTVGRVSPGNEVAMFDADGEPVPMGEVGEIGCKGPNNSFGYYFNDEAADAVLFNQHGYAMTGDLGCMDPDGYLQVSGRTKDIIIRGGQNILPQEIERVALEHADVRDVAIVAAKDERLGEVACACVVPREGAQVNLESLTDHLRAAGLASYKLPERLLLVGTIPRTAADKVARNVLRDLVAESGHELQSRTR